MKPKSIVTTALLLFVAASVVYLLVKETGGNPDQNAQSGTASSRMGQEHETAALASAENATAADKVVVYYFHGDVRCMTCRTIEAYTKEAIDVDFADALKDGRMEWRVVNVEAPGNDHYVKDFQLSTRSVVLERLADGKAREWKNLERVWELIRGDKEDFLKYIQDETRAYLEAVGK
jgi:hypothetical protein